MSQWRLANCFEPPLLSHPAPEDSTSKQQCTTTVWEPIAHRKETLAGKNCRLIVYTLHQ